MLRMIRNIGLAVIVLGLFWLGAVWFKSHYDLDQIKIKDESKVTEIPSEIWTTTNGTKIEVIEMEGYKLIKSVDGNEIQILYHIESHHLMEQEIGIE